MYSRCYQAVRRRTNMANEHASDKTSFIRYQHPENHIERELISSNSNTVIKIQIEWFNRQITEAGWPSYKSRTVVCIDKPKSTETLIRYQSHISPWLSKLDSIKLTGENWTTTFLLPGLKQPTGYTEDIIGLCLDVLTTKNISFNGVVPFTR